MRSTTRDPGSILDTCRAFMSSRVLLTAVELDLFERLARKGSTAEKLAGELGSDLRATTLLLDALAAMRFLAKKKEVYTVAAGVAGLLDGSETSVRPMARHLVSMWRNWDHLTQVVRTGRPPKTQKSARTQGDLESFIHAMRVISAPVAGGIARAIAPGSARRLLDIGAGPAVYTMAVVRLCPDLHATVFDLPPVIEIARREVKRAGLSRRFSFVAGDFYRDPLPAGHDLALLSAIIHQNSPAENRALYGKIHDALVPGGRLVIRDHVMDPSRTRPAAGALFAINMLVNTEGGATYTRAEIRSDLRAAGFGKIRQIRAGANMDSLVEATRMR